ncbi:MAG: hypothetical protein OEY13_07640 [Gammaproteobacteria bacterium]|nr:hypothetical protein [Gammaproteobacteria bacterium]MDH4311546.1 hypothetical protein [Gammaproteobacteria bacterium]MDH5272933.1 hypothetical protein [Gammaproteobacteria bacterium]
MLGTLYQDRGGIQPGGGDSPLTSGVTTAVQVGSASSFRIVSAIAGPLPGALRGLLEVREHVVSRSTSCTATVHVDRVTHQFGLPISMLTEFDLDLLSQLRDFRAVA